MLLSLDTLNKQKIEVDEISLIKDPISQLLLNSINEYYHNDFITLMNNINEKMNNLLININTESIKIHTEDYSKVIMKILEVLKEYAIRIGKFLMFWKKKVITYFDNHYPILESLHKELIDVPSKLSNKSVKINFDKLSTITGIYYILPNYEKDTHDNQMEGSSNQVNNLHSFFKDIMKKYVNDPEMNNSSFIYDAELSEDVISIRKLLGIEINSNQNNALVSSRINIHPLNVLYVNIHIDGSSLDMKTFIGEFDSDVFMPIATRVKKIMEIYKEGNTIENLLRTIEKSYDKLDRGVKLKIFDRDNRDASVDIARTEALVKAKDHINKSKTIIERFTQILNLEYQNITLLSKALLHSLE